MTTLPAISEKSYLTEGTTLRSWLLTHDHKRIALLFLFSISCFLIVGGTAAMLMRLELLSPCTAWSWSGFFSSPQSQMCSGISSSR
jgi:heme/copper-type cytochrome/quinol oxidase subunit 1